MGNFLVGIWQLIRELLSSPAFWGFAGVMAGGWLTRRTEFSLKRHERDRDMQFAAASLSAVLDRFISACSDVAADDGTYMGQDHPDGILRAQTDLPSLDYSSLTIEWRSLPSLTVDRLFLFQNHIYDEQSRLKFEQSFDGPPYDGYFFERRLAFVDLGIEAEAVVRDLRTAAGLTAYPETRSLAFLKERKEHFEDVKVRLAANQLPLASE